MSCPDWFELVSAAADGQVSAGEQARLDQHVTGCGPCRDLLRRFEQDRRRRRLAPPADHTVFVGRVLEERAEAHAAGSPIRTLARRGAVAVVAVAAVVTAFAAAPRAGTPTPEPTDAQLAAAQVLIDADGQSFDLQDVEVHAGTTVEWRNTGTSTHHLVRRLGGAVVSEDLAPGASEVATFAEPGTYEFFCTIHDGMSGTVTVDA